MRRLQPVIWAKGTFLSPQHLQAQDIFHEDLMQFRVDALNYFPWGFRSLTLDRDALAAGNLAIDSASGIFPDGLVFDIPNYDLAPSPKPLAAYFDPTRTTIDVHLAVPAWRYGNVRRGHYFPTPMPTRAIWPKFRYCAMKTHHKLRGQSPNRTQEFSSVGGFRSARRYSRH